MSESGPTIAARPAEETDAAPIALLCGQLGYPSREEEVLRRLRLILRDADHAVLVAQVSDGRVVGWIHVFGARLVEHDPRAEIGGVGGAGGIWGRGGGAVFVRGGGTGGAGGGA